MKIYHVEFAIDVVAETSEEACRHAWKLMTQSCALLPVGTVVDPESGKREKIDLQGLAEEKERPAAPAQAASGQISTETRRLGVAE